MPRSETIQRFVVATNDQRYFTFKGGNTDLGLEEVLGAADSDLIDVDLALPREDSESGILAELAGRSFPENEEEFAEGNVAVGVLVHFLEQGLIVVPVKMYILRAQMMFSRTGHWALFHK